MSKKAYFGLVIFAVVSWVVCMSLLYGIEVTEPDWHGSRNWIGFITSAAFGVALIWGYYEYRKHDHLVRLYPRGSRIPIDVSVHIRTSFEVAKVQDDKLVGKLKIELPKDAVLVNLTRFQVMTPLHYYNWPGFSLVFSQGDTAHEVICDWVLRDPSGTELVPRGVEVVSQQ